MNVRVRLFAALRDAVGCESFELALPDRIDAADVVEAIRTRFGEAAHAAVSAESVRIAVNREFVEHPFRLRDGDEIAFMPPVTGG